MNGELALMSNIVICARKAMHSNESIECGLEKYILTVKFMFESRGTLSKMPRAASSVEEWFNICKEHGLQDVKFIAPTSVPDRFLLGFSNASQGLIVCFWENGKVTYFSGNWEFDRANEGWKVVYKEHEWNDAPSGKPTFSDRTEEFKQVLLEIEALANKIEFDNFAKLFHRAYNALCGNVQGSDSNKWIKNIPIPYRNIYLAIMYSDVFGAMGSWNDSPPYYAKEKGLEKEYDDLSNKLLELIRYNLMYVTNECWKLD